LDNYNDHKYFIPSTKIPKYELQSTDYQRLIEYPTKKFEEYSDQGKITTEIYISRQPLLLGESLDLIIIYTPYKHNTGL
jgi:hypothetical protein